MLRLTSGGLLPVQMLTAAELTYAGSVVGGTKDELRGSIVARADVGHVRLPTDQLLSTENTFEMHQYYLKSKNMT